LFQENQAFGGRPVDPLKSGEIERVRNVLNANAVI
jgi:hypothetical protein